jgi:hypothetical protein
MNDTVAFSPNSSLTALRGAVGEVVGAGDAVGCWDRVVSLWRIFWALDGLIAVLWGIVDRLRAGEMVLEGRCPVGAVAVLRERAGRAGCEPARVRAAVAGIRAVVGRRVLARPVVSVGRARVDLGSIEPGLVGMSPVLAILCWRFSNGGLDLSQNHVPIVPD